MHSESAPLFEILAQDISEKGYSICPNALPAGLSLMLSNLLHDKQLPPFLEAGIGRGITHTINKRIRTDAISWIDNSTEAGIAWINWATDLQAFLNARLFLGLFSFESHFARYTKGDYYQRHQDAFSGQNNRILSVVLYLNEQWLEADAGELLLFVGGENGSIIKVAPAFGTLVAFLSEDFPHEVVMTNAERFSIAGWFRANGSSTDRIDPPC